MSADLIVSQIRQGSKRSISRFISSIENQDPHCKEILSKLYRYTGQAHVIGITGPPGVGKSSLINHLIGAYRSENKSIGVICVDPSSPFSGGALLGDRLRMQRFVLDKEVYIRSMGTRGFKGGVSKATSDVIRVLDAAGKEIILIETVGVGQSEIDIMKFVHTIIVVDMPGTGDEIQSFKAGLMEIGDIFVVNKSDLDGIEKKVSDLRSYLDRSPKKQNWIPRIIQTNSRKGVGIKDLVQQIKEHMTYLKLSKQLFEINHARSKEELIQIIEYNLRKEITSNLNQNPELSTLLKQLAYREIDPYTTAEKILEKIIHQKEQP